MSMPRDGYPVPPPPGADRTRGETAHHWLLRSAPHHQHAGTEWNHSGITLLRAGVNWDAVRAPYETFGLDRDAPAEALRRRMTELEVTGPLFCDPYRPYVYALVPPATDSDWPQDLTAAGYPCLGGTSPYVHHVGVPAPYRTAPPGCFWLTPPDPGGKVHVDPDRLCLVLREREALLGATTAPGSP